MSEARESGRCETCRFWGGRPFTKNEWGEPSEACKRYPPNMQNEWPETFHTDWCGEYQPRETDQ